MIIVVLSLSQRQKKKPQHSKATSKQAFIHVVYFKPTVCTLKNKGQNWLSALFSYSFATVAQVYPVIMQRDSPACPENLKAK